MTHVEPAAGKPASLSEDSFRDLLKQQFPRYTAYARSLTRDTDKAMDAVQNAMVGVLRGNSRPATAAKVYNFMQTAIRRAVYDVSSAKKRHYAKINALAQEVHDETSSPPDGPTIVDSQQRWVILLADPQDRASLLRQLSKLTKKQRQIIELVLVDRVSISTARRILGISDGTARKHIARAVASARRLDQGGAVKQSEYVQRMQIATLEAAQIALDAGVASTDYQREVLLAVVRKGGNVRQAARDMSVDRSHMRDVLRILAKRAEAQLSET